MNELSRRNGNAVLTTLQRYQDTINRQHERIDLLHNAVAGLLMRVQELEKYVAVHKVVTTGLGPTVK